MWTALFAAANLLALAGWIMLIFLPRRPVALAAVLYLGTGLLSAVYAVLLVLLLAVRPASNALRSNAKDGGSLDPQGAGGEVAALGGPGMGVVTPYDREALDGQIELAQRIARENPDDAVLALRRLLAEDIRQ